MSADTPPVPAGPVPPDDRVPTWTDRKARRTGLARLTYEYFERSRREDQDLRTESSYVERDVLAFPTCPTRWFGTSRSPPSSSG